MGNRKNEKGKKVYSIHTLKVRSAVVCLLACAAAFAANPKKVLVFSLCESFNHRDSIETGKKAIAEEAARMNYTADFSLDYEALKLENLKKYDTLVLNNTTHLKGKAHPFMEQALVDYVKQGGGLCVIHAALDNFYDAPACAYMCGGQFDGHPWGGNGTWKFHVEDTTSPLTTMFKLDATGGFFASDEIYQQKSPFYDRSQLHVLISLDMSDATTNGRPGQKRADRDNAVAWVRAFGQGRVFYTSFAHDGRAWRDARRQHLFAGLAYCLGDLKTDDQPKPVAWELLTPMQRTARVYECAIRKDAKCIAAHIDDANSEVARAATLALGRVGGAEALARLAQSVEKPGADALLADARQTAFGAAIAETALKDMPLAARYAKTAFGMPAATDNLRAVAAKVLVAYKPDFFPTAVADRSKLVVQAALDGAANVPAATLAKVLAEAKCPCLKVALMKRIATNRAAAAIPTVAACIQDENEGVAATAVETLAAVGSADGVAAILGARARGGRVQGAADEALAEMGGIGAKVFELAQKDPSVLAVAAKRAELKLVGLWSPFFASSDEKTRKAAWRAFGKMTSPEVLDQTVAWFAAIQDAEKSPASTALWHVLKDVDAAKRDAQLLGLWKKGSPAAREAAADLIFRSKSLEAFDFWTKVAEDPAVAKAAKLEYVKRAEAFLNDAANGNAKLDRGSWKGSSSRDNGNAAKAFDGNAESRWTSGMNSKDVWYALDLGANFFVEEVTLDTTKSPKDTPAGCDVFASFDGASWKKVATCDDKSTLKTTFKIAASARHLKFVALNNRPNLYWSIHEIDVKAATDKALVEKIRATAAKYRAEAK